MKRVLYGVVIFILLMSSCSPEGMSTLPGSWTLGTGTTGAFSAAGSTVTNTLIASNDFPPNPDSLFFYFNTYPTSNGSYTIVNSVHPAAGQLGIRLSQGLPPATIYVPAPSSAGSYATVTIKSGKVSIKVPLVQFENPAAPLDTADFLATINQTQ